MDKYTPNVTMVGLDSWVRVKVIHIAGKHITTKNEERKLTGNSKKRLMGRSG